jgi:hypothetical protein
VAQTCNWFTVLSALLTPVIAALAVFIAWQQWQTNRNKLKFELFDRRLVVYQAAQDLLSVVTGSGDVPSEKSFEFLMRTRAAKFLFDDEIDQYLYRELYAKAVALQTLNSELKDVPVGDERSRLARERKEVFDWFAAQIEALDRKFSPFLQLGH